LIRPAAGTVAAISAIIADVFAAGFADVPGRGDRLACSPVRDEAATAAGLSFQKNGPQSDMPDGLSVSTVQRA
jgi:hypothetical protein